VAQLKVQLSSRAPTASVIGRGFVNDSLGLIGRGFVPQSEVLLALETLTEYTGRQRPLPAWADEGAIVGVQGGSDVVRRVVRVLHEAGVPLSAVWMQDWVGARDTLWGSRLWWNWHVDAQVYTGWTALRAELRAQQPPIRMLTYVNSMLSDLGGTPRLRNASRHMFAEAARQGYLVHAEPSTLLTPPLALSAAAATPAVPSSQVPSSQVPSWGAAASSAAASSAAGSVAPPAAKPHFVEVGGYTAAMLDLTNPRARDWMRVEVFGREMLGSGPGASDGWMADFGEALPCEGVQLHDKSAPCSYHNRYPVEWARLNWEAAEEAGVADDVLIFSRSGYTTSPGVARLFWLGDQLHTWDEHDGFASAVTATLSGGLSGFALTHSDVGGYTSIDHTSLFMTSLVGYRGVSLLRDRELLLRWVEANAFSGAVFRTHEGLLPRENHQIWTDPETLAHFRRFVLVFRAFRPYRRALMQEAAERGWPLIRHPVLHFPDDPTLRNDRAQADGGEGRIRGFMIGADWLVYPVLEPGVNSVRAYIPSGDWVPLWTSAPTQQQPQPPPSTLKGTSVQAEHAAQLAESVPVHGHVHGPGWHQLPAPLGQPAVYHRRGAPSAQAIREVLTQLGVLKPLTWASS
jgi:alpha-glucosidase